MPCFDGLFNSEEFDNIVQDLLFDFATWYSYAHLRLQTDSTLATFEKVTGYLGESLRKFAEACEDIDTLELPSEARKRRRNAKGNGGDGDSSDRRRKYFNLHTFKMHALGHQIQNTRYYGVPCGNDSKPVSVTLFALCHTVIDSHSSLSANMFA
jgi:hypothetical protein